MPPIRHTSTTREVLVELGRRLQRYRLQQNQRLEDIATAAGISVPTAQRAEAGRNATVATVVKMLRALGRLDALDAFLQEPLVSPVELAERAGKTPQGAGRGGVSRGGHHPRQRASRRKPSHG